MYFHEIRLGTNFNILRANGEMPQENQAEHMYVYPVDQH